MTVRADPASFAECFGSLWALAIWETLEAGCECCESYTVAISSFSVNQRISEQADIVEAINRAIDLNESIYGGLKLPPVSFWMIRTS